MEDVYELPPFDYLDERGTNVVTSGPNYTGGTPVRGRLELLSCGAYHSPATMRHVMTLVGLNLACGAAKLPPRTVPAVRPQRDISETSQPRGHQPPVDQNSRICRPIRLIRLNMSTRG